MFSHERVEFVGFQQVLQQGIESDGNVFHQFDPVWCLKGDLKRVTDRDIVPAGAHTPLPRNVTFYTDGNTGRNGDIGRLFHSGHSMPPKGVCRQALFSDWMRLRAEGFISDLEWRPNC